jgi:hypothetical protein
MAIQFVLLLNKQGRSRLSKWYTNIEDEEKLKIEREIYRTIILRDSKHSNFIEFRNYKVIYKKYASLYFVFCVDLWENELGSMEFIHLFVETLDKFFGSVCELDVVYNFYKVYAILDELIIGGEIIESSKAKVVQKQREMEFYD